MKLPVSNKCDAKKGKNAVTSSSSFMLDAIVWKTWFGYRIYAVED